MDVLMKETNTRKFVTHVRPVGDFPRSAAVFVKTFALLGRFLTLVAQDGVQYSSVVHHAVQRSFLQCLKKKFKEEESWRNVWNIPNSCENRQQMALPVFQVKHRDWWQGVQDPATQRGQVSRPHFWTVAGCLGDGPIAGLSGSLIPASSHNVASTDLVTLFRRTKHWTARTWKPLPPQVCEHLDHGVRSHSNFKLSALPWNKKEKMAF